MSTRLHHWRKTSRWEGSSEAVCGYQGPDWSNFRTGREFLYMLRHYTTFPKEPCPRCILIAHTEDS